MRIAVLGEGMLELARPGDGGSGRDGRDGQGWQLGFGGDTLNTAVHLARFGLATSYVTALGSDPFSDALRRDWAAEGLDIGHILTDPERLPGLYAIRTDSDGERAFFYWRSASAVRHLFSLPGIDAALQHMAEADLLYLSLITLAVIPLEAAGRVYDLCDRVRRNGGRVAFDSNYRPRLWADAEAARTAVERMAGLCDIALPTASDEAILFGTGDPAAIATRWHHLGASEVAVKLSAEGCLLSQAGDHQLVPAVTGIRPTDTSGAGDAFNAGYLQARLGGQDRAGAARCGHALAAWVITCNGALPPRSASAPYTR